MKRIVLTLLSLLLMSTANASNAYEPNRNISILSESIIKPSDVAYLDGYGLGVSILGNKALVGAPGNDDLGDEAGTVYYYEFNGVNWILTQKLYASDADASKLFGVSVLLTDEFAFVGSSFGNDIGSVYVFELENSIWTEKHILRPADNLDIGFFGDSLSFSENRLLAGAPYPDDMATYQGGTAYLFEYDGNNWHETHTFTPSDFVTDQDGFGIEVLLSNDLALVSSPAYGTNGSRPGAVFIYEYDGSTWVETHILTANDTNENIRFGDAIEIIDDDIAVLALNSGEIYIFENDGNTWIDKQKLMAVDSNDDWDFRWSIEHAGNLLAIGARLVDGTFNDTGAVFLFERINGSWEQSNIVKAGDDVYDNWYSVDISISNNSMIVGAPAWDDVNGGSAYIYNLSQSRGQSVAVPSFTSVGMLILMALIALISKKYLVRLRSQSI